ncbi:MAG TPA: hypothetical protein DCE42_15905 [Myxococcales bacterium]|nr:hypothetical protein [Deltaproteobacteria bacterium]HAA56248.1 hypothetical protein [Myxococcales bacterium]
MISRIVCMFLSIRVWIVLCVFCSLPLLTHCEYIARFYIQINEGPNNPCLGISHFTFVIEGLTADSSEDVRHHHVTGVHPSELLWDSAGRCQISGIPLKNINFGGRKQIIITAFDSTNTAISTGKSDPFLLEPSGEEVQQQIALPIQRAADKKKGTLVIRFTEALPPATNRIEVLLDKVDALPQDLRRISINTKTDPPTFLIISNVPDANNRNIQLTAYSSDKKAGDYKGTYTLPTASATPGTASQHVQRLTAKFSTQ